jgi:hypothetical protein
VDSDGFSDGAERMAEGLADAARSAIQLARDIPEITSNIASFMDRHGASLKIAAGAVGFDFLSGGVLRRGLGAAARTGGTAVFRAVRGQRSAAGAAAATMAADATPVFVTNWPGGVGGALGDALGKGAAGGGASSAAWLGRAGVGMGGIAAATTAFAAAAILPQLAVLHRLGQSHATRMEATNARARQALNAEADAREEAAREAVRLARGEGVAPYGPTTPSDASRQSVDAVMGAVMANLNPAGLIAGPNGPQMGAMRVSGDNLAFARAGVERLFGGAGSTFTGSPSQRALMDMINEDLAQSGLRASVQTGQTIGQMRFDGGVGSLTDAQRESIRALDELNQVIGITSDGQPVNPDRFNAARRVELMESGDYERLNAIYANLARTVERGAALAERLNTTSGRRFEGSVDSLIRIDNIEISTLEGAGDEIVARLAPDLERALTALLEGEQSSLGE